ncbi:DUF6928 family protein [Corynebacterium choanae]|uniref:Uncharacterized protein n=1 Tax=Corynebacterium choanae TaxID=1862358 RepID=A0A3G6J7Z9_9CORY|nr:hypothetical protein [Corynebacterium choanae]AZA13028.1 hypothetical protein CCHOA_03075 [Corynebacterium choanae]
MTSRMPNPGTVVTLWFVNTDQPLAAVTSGTHADRGFGRKYLAQLNPRWPITPIGQFPLNRSVPASADEFYIAGYPHVTMVQTVRDDILELSTIDPRLLHSLPAEDVYIFAVNTTTGYAGCAHFSAAGGDLQPQRLFAAKRNRVYEDVGLPEPFEQPLWAGEVSPPSDDPLDLPFAPTDFVTAAHQHWLGFTVDAQGPSLFVSAFAVDGRPEPKVAAPRAKHSMEHLIESSAKKLQLHPADRDYDDYERPLQEVPNTSLPIKDTLVSGVKQASAVVGSIAGSLYQAWKHRKR